MKTVHISLPIAPCRLKQIVGVVLAVLIAVGVAPVPAARAQVDCMANTCYNITVIAGPTSGTTGNTAQNTFDLPAHTVPSYGSNTVLVAVVALGKYRGNTLAALFDVRVNGVANSMIRYVRGTGSQSQTAQRGVEIWYQLNPSPGSKTITLLVDNTNTDTYQLTGYVYTLSGVNQDTSTWRRSPDSDIGVDNGGTGSPVYSVPSPIPSTWSTSGPNAIVLDGITIPLGSGGNANTIDGVSPADASTVTQTMAASLTATAGQNDIRTASSYILDPTIGTQRSGYTRTGGSSAALAAMSLGPALVTDVGLTAFDARSFSGSNAKAGTPGTLLQWRAGYEADNLGYNLYRETQTGERVRITRELIAGSTLAGRTNMSAGYDYAWWDASGTGHDRYWLEAVDVYGQSHMHGPFVTTPSTDAAPIVTSSATMDSLNTGARPASHPYLEGLLRQRAAKVPGNSGGGSKGQPVQWGIASGAALKLTVRDAGWYRVTQPELVASGMDPSRIDPTRLQLFADGVEQAIQVTGAEDGRFDPQDAIEFFGLGADTAATDTRTYWLVQGTKAGQRIKAVGNGSGAAQMQSYPYTVELKERLIYAARVANGEKENFFGRPVVSTPLDQHLTAPHVSSKGSTATVDVALQSISAATQTIAVSLNGSPIGQVPLAGFASGSGRFSVPASAILDGDNVVTLGPAPGSSGVSLVDNIRLTYTREPVADQNQLYFTPVLPRSAALATGFTSPSVRVVDVSTPSSVQEYLGTIGRDGALYTIGVQVPATARRTLYAFASDQVKSPVSIEANRPSRWFDASNAADLVIITHASLMNEATALAGLRRNQGIRTAVVDVEDLYDEFSFGAHASSAISAFLSRAKSSWSVAPRFVLLFGGATFDPRDYLHSAVKHDLVPTRLADTSFFEAPWDDGLADVNGDDVADFAVGRLPVQTPAEAQAVVAKLAAFEQSGAAPHRTLLVADQPDAAGDFEATVSQLNTLFPADYATHSVYRGVLGDSAARDETLSSINSGQTFVHFSGHGSVRTWHGNLLVADDAPTLGNASSPSVFTMSNCLNGYYIDPSLDSLGEALIKTPSGGAVSVWASSGVTSADMQKLLITEFYRQLFQTPNLTVGEAAARAKATASGDIRRTWVLIGDPTLRIR